MQASRSLISILAAVGTVTLAGYVVAQTTTTPTPGATTTVTPPLVTTTETEAERLNRERMSRDGMTTSETEAARMARERMGTTETEADRMARERAGTTETGAERLTRERLARERMARERMNAPDGSGSMNSQSADTLEGSTARRDANGNLIARADRN